MYNQMNPQAIVKNNWLSGDSSFLLDLLRVIACEMIVICHTFSLYIFYNDMKYNNNLLIWKIDSFLAIMGVMLFFFVSGIVISNSLFSKLDKGNYNFTSFFIDRFSRIYSGLIPCLIFIFIIDLLMMSLNGQYYQKTSKYFGSPGLSGGIFLANLFMIQYIPPLNIPRPPFAEILWTLNIEWWLYMLFGWAVIHFRKILKLDVKSVAILVALSLFPAYRLLVGPHSLISVWFFGVLITVLLTREKSAGLIRKYFLYMFGIILALTAIRFAMIAYQGDNFYDIPLELLVGCLILLLVINFNGSNFIRSARFKRFVKTMARYSFTLYLINMVIIGLFFACYSLYRLNLDFIWILLISLVSTNSIAFILAYFTEMRYKSLSAWIKSKVQAVHLHKQLNANELIKN